MTDEELLLAKIRDKDRLCTQKCVLSASGFLTESEQAAVMRELSENPPDNSYVLWGGFPESERKMIAFLPEWMSYRENELSFSEAGAVAVRIKVKGAGFGGKVLSHRDYLGTLMGLGIARGCVGDIIVGSDGADIIVTEEIGDFLAKNLERVGGEAVSAEIIPEAELSSHTAEYDEIKATVASPRADSICAAAFRISREDSAKAIKQGRFFIDGELCTEADTEVSEGAKLTLRGSGKAIFAAVTGKSKKGRLCVTFKRPKN